MYLKSLVLKGFKSFADRSVMSLEPGITAIVGPNGSGKSNISDAVLWVLGERSARNLRGQAMEDIIFSGSAARKAVSVAEVDLVLDNSDHVLPVDFDEVSITRRMYRSGESEYLVNGVVVRRLDVLDILHDSGLGTGTHSIISQGSLDSILQSRPEDRRALIEEAAGVLKHRRRKEKSQRKLDQMENHLARVRDVTAEVARQLGPLERKAKRAEAYVKARDELYEVRLALAVDDLRTLQGEWDAICAAEQEVAGDVDAKRESVNAAERKVNDYQELLRRESEGANVIARRQRKAINLSDRLDGAEMVLRERRRAAEDSIASMAATLESAKIRREDAVSELRGVEEQLLEVRAACEKAEALVVSLAEKRSDVDERRRGIESAISEATASLHACERKLEKAKRRQADLQQSLANGRAQVKLAETRSEELSESFEGARQADVQARQAAEAATNGLEQLKEREAKAQNELVTCFRAREEARKLRDQALADEHLASVEAQAIEQALAALRDDDPALSWVIGHADRFGGELLQVSRAFEVKRGLEALVEALLGHDLAALAVPDGSSALQIADALDEQGVVGDLSLVMRAEQAGRMPAEDASAHRLLDDLRYTDDMRAVVEALLGDVIVCRDRAETLAAHKTNPSAGRYVSPDGFVVWPSGKVQILRMSAEDGEGIIAREQRLRDLRERSVALEGKRIQAEEAAEQADEAYRSMQAEALKLSQQLANAKGASEAAAAEAQRTAKRLADIEREMRDASRKAQAATQKLGQMETSLDEAAVEVEAQTARLATLRQSRQELTSAVSPLRDEATQLGEKYTEARLEAAQMKERRTYVERLVIARKRDVEALDADAAKARSGIAVKNVAVGRCQVALSVFERLATSLERRVRYLDEAASISESNSSTVHAGAATARDEARKAHDEYDAASSRMAQVRIDKGKLEMRVEVAVNTIVDELKTPLDRAQELPPLEDRRGAEDTSFKLQRKLKNMGAINPDAAQDYAELKRRYDYLAGQLADMESARKSLGRIVKVIDARMRDDFVRTFDQVNQNFGEIFSELFPGGNAHLYLDDPADIESTGVEVTAQPAGKRLTKMMLMSGGEKSLTALALLFAVYKTRATPFYILDEVEAALDDSNLRRLASYIDKLRCSTQLIMITHQRRTMEMADVLFGVSMHADGVTKVISQKLERALEHAE